MLEFLVDKLIALMGTIATLSTEKRELRDNALRAISTALQETKIYYACLGRGQQRDYDTEAQLARYWGAAAIPLRHIDEELAMICENKADFWIDPEHWSGEKIEQFGIKLEDVTKAYRQLARLNFNKARALKHP